MDNIKIVKGGYDSEGKPTIYSIQVWTEELPGRPFPAWAVLLDLNEDGTLFQAYPNSPDVVELRKQILERIL